VARKIARSDFPWVALVGASFIVGIAASWERWGNPLVDCGREMNQPLRLARGEMLYSDVRHIYGPLSPYVNATLYRIFGPSLDVLYADGIISSIIILALVYWIARQLMGRAASAIAALEVMWLCAFKQAGNYVLPYSYSAVHACALGLATLALLLKAISCQRAPEEEKEKRGSGEEVKGRAGDEEQTNRAETAEERKIIGKESPAASSPILPLSHSPDLFSPLHFLKNITAFYLTVAGFVAGLTILAKTEMGLAAFITGAIAAWLAGHPSIRRSFSLTSIFVAPALMMTVAVYWIIGQKAGWQVLANESFLFFQNLPPELIYFNKRMSGFDAPLLSLAQIFGAAIKMGAMAGLISAVTLLITSRKQLAQKNETAERTITNAGRISPYLLWALLVVSLAMMFVPAGASISWEQGPYLAMPVLLAAFLIAGLFRYQKLISEGANARQTLALIIVATYALASLARVMLRVRSGGAYSSYLLPASVIMFTYAWLQVFPGLFGQMQARRLARNIMVWLMLVHACATGILLSARYRTKNTYPIETERGQMIAVPDMGIAINKAIDFVGQNTLPGEYVAVMPEGTSINFLADRPNPLREEITTPGFLDAVGQERAIRQLIDSDTRVVFITNRATSEFSQTVFGRDYNQRLMRWIEENFRLETVLGPDDNPDLQIGDGVFFIKAYVRK